MKLNEIIELFEENYDEIDVFEHIKAWSTEIAIGYRTFALCTFVNKNHDIVIQTMVYYPVNDADVLEDSPIYQTYIGYTEDPENIIHKAFRIKEGQNPIDYSIYSDLEKDMGWLDDEVIPEEEPIVIEENKEDKEDTENLPEYYDAKEV